MFMLPFVGQTSLIQTDQQFLKLGSGYHLRIIAREHETATNPDKIWVFSPGSLKPKASGQLPDIRGSSPLRSPWSNCGSKSDGAAHSGTICLRAVREAWH